jgi:hypothetical protein
MMGGRPRDARRTERYLDGLMEAGERGVADVPMDVDIDPAVVLAARQLRADLIRVHPSFHFEEGLAARLARTARRMNAGLSAAEPAEQMLVRTAPAPIAPFRVPGVAASAGPASAELASVELASVELAAAHERIATPAVGPHKLPTLATRTSRPFIVGGVGVGVASAAISIGAVYVAWRWSRASQTPMVRAVRAARSGRGHASGHGRRAGVLNGILGVTS